MGFGDIVESLGERAAESQRVQNAVDKHGKETLAIGAVAVAAGVALTGGAGALLLPCIGGLWLWSKSKKQKKNQTGW